MKAQLISQARTLAANYLDAVGRSRDAVIVRAGGGDDFTEVAIALSTLEDISPRLDRFRRALDCYAEAPFWDADCPDAIPALYDRGEIARAALAGKELYELHRD